jgi:plastocyanin
MQRFGRSSVLAIVVLALLGLVLVACGGDDDDSGGNAKDQVVQATDGKVTVTAHDLYFSAKEIDASPGSLAVTLENKGAVLHDLKIDDPAFKVSAAAGKSATKSLTVEAGKTYPYYCDVPGHRATMHGTIVVK